MGSLISLALSLLGNWQRIAVYTCIAAAVGITVWMHGYFTGKQALYEYQARQAREAVKIVVKQGEVTERVVTKYVKVKAEAVVLERVVEKEVTRYVESNPGYCLDAEWRRLHDESTGAAPQAPGGPDGAGGAPPTAAEALKTGTENNARCKRTADRLDGLQEWVRGQSQVRPE